MSKECHLTVLIQVYNVYMHRNIVEPNSNGYQSTPTTSRLTAKTIIKSFQQTVM